MLDNAVAALIPPYGKRGAAKGGKPDAKAHMRLPPGAAAIAPAARNRLSSDSSAWTGRPRVQAMLRCRLFSLVAFLSVMGGEAKAHAIILESTPRPEATIEGSTLGIEIRFSSRIDVGRSHIRLIKRDGEAVSVPLVDPDAEDTLKASATGLTPGRYRLHWQTLSPDGHITQGDIPFSVNR